MADITVTKKTELTVCIRGPCNYACEYCIGHNRKDPVLLHDLKKLEYWLSGIGGFIVSIFECGSSEPTIHPQIKDLISLLTKYGQLTIPTNNSIDPAKYIPEDCISRVKLLAAFHTQSENHIDDYIARLLWVQQKGGIVSASYIAYPPRIKKVDLYKQKFVDAGIYFSIIPFEGEYEGIVYPEGHTEEHKKIMGLSDGKDSSWYRRLSLDATIRNFENIPCLAGYTKILIDGEGYLRRCLYDHVPIEQPFNEAKPCTVSYCGCGMYLKELNTQTPRYWNQYLRQCNLSIEEIDKTEDQMYTENYIKYWELMSKYHKLRGLNK